MVMFVDRYREEYGVEAICRVIPIAPATYYEQKRRKQNPLLVPKRIQSDEMLKQKIQTTWEDNYKVYGARKIWRKLNKDGISVARCTVERLMNHLDIEGTTRGKKPKTTVPSEMPERPSDLVNRDFTATEPNQLWVADLTYVATWNGFVYVAFIIDVFSRFIVGWRVSSSLQSDLAIDALEQAIHARPVDDGLIHHSDRGVQYLSIRYTERMKEVGIISSVGSVGDSYDNAMAETINGLYKTEVIRKRGPWKKLEDVEFATLEWVDWFNNRRLLGPLGYLSPSEFEKVYYNQIEAQTMVV